MYVSSFTGQMRVHVHGQGSRSAEEARAECGYISSRGRWTWQSLCSQLELSVSACMAMGASCACVHSYRHQAGGMHIHDIRSCNHLWVHVWSIYQILWPRYLKWDLGSSSGKKEQIHETEVAKTKNCNVLMNKSLFIHGYTAK